MWEVLFEPAADAAMTALERDPARARPLERIDAALQGLARNPGDGPFRRRTYAPAGDMWGFLVRSHDDERLIIWRYGPGDDQLTVRYVGPDL